MADRAEWEIHSLFILWAATLVWAISRTEQRAWVECLSLTAGLFAAVPVVNALSVPRNGVVGLLSGDWLFVAFDIAMLMLAASFGYAARKAARATTAKPPRRARAIKEELATA
jgi:hypothetical protein